MNTLRHIALIAITLVVSVLMLSGFAVLGLVALGLAFTGSLIAIAHAAWKNRATLTTDYKVVA